jgi:hypothetical protein
MDRVEAARAVGGIPVAAPPAVAEDALVVVGPAQAAGVVALPAVATLVVGVVEDFLAGVVTTNSPPQSFL